ncbi:DNA replication/repair protein RecF [Streptococcus oricebi]|uniref:DNA replication and repair protein RecF n=1 Tax=Streptococcus oricebi TaxID=1547447 RepID=A0ABS5B5N4_9STRE|nr:DNA replication/repair protein RecF [Streptococcus oricebi]MBP2624120.1 DNA replication/repair protein RecF [Streptococcus oricebi]
MWLKELEIKNFRNYETAKIDFSPALNIFLGQNAQGKTNILEAIYFLALTRSHRTRSDKDLIQFSKETLQVSGLVVKSTSSIPVDIELTSKGRTSKINHLKQGKLSDYIGTVNVVLFAPEDLQLVKGAPSLRRKFIDIELGQIKPIYLSDLSHYNHFLKQRNAYLKANDRIDEAFLSVLDEQLIDYGCRVIKQRLDFLEKLEQLAQEKHWDISQNTEKLTLKYLSTVPFEDLNDLEASFRSALEKSRKRDLFKKNTGLGPHRDDLGFFINQMDLNFGSQGQQRSLVLSLKLAEIKLIESITKESPILLLDDVMSELDNRRQLKLLETITDNIQTFITTTSLEHLKNLPKNISIFNIKQGVINKD